MAITWLPLLTSVAQKIEGPYKHYIIYGVIILLTAIISRIVFKTIKWFLLLACLTVLFFGIAYYLFR